MGILYLGERQRVGLFVRRDTFGRFLSCLVFVPRDRFNTENRRRIEAILRRAFHASSSDYTTRVSESVLVRLHYRVYIEPGRVPEYDVREIETLLVAATRSWADDLEERADPGARRGARQRAAPPLRRGLPGRLPGRLGGALGRRRHRADRGPARGRRPHADASTSRSRRRPACCARSCSAPARRWRSRTCCRCSRTWACRWPTSGPYEVTPRDREPVWIYDFGLTYAGAGELEADRVREAFKDCFVRAWRGDVEDDGYNRLLLRAGLTWREITVLRAVAKYLRQAGTTFSDTYVERALVAHPQIARMFVDLFKARFEPATGDPERAESVGAQIEQAIDAVESLDEDRILRSFLAVIRAMLRTNYFQRARERRPEAVPLVQARPVEPAVAAAAPAAVRDLRVLAAHRGRAPARRQGGARRAALVGPARGLPHRGARPDEGADGEERGDRAGRREGRLRGEAPAAADREALLEEVERCYRTFIRGLLDLTDNIVAGEIVPPPRRRALRRRRPVPGGGGRQGHRDASPTSPTGSPASTASGSATRSPRAARPATTTRRWASPRAARGSRSSATSASSAATSSSRTSPSVGIGDMSGDVFGNGMLLSRHIRLVAAFDHRDIFIDPNPDPAASFEERRRLFELPRSSWADYDTGADLGGRRRLPAHREVDPAVARGARGARHRAGGADAGRADLARSCARPSTCSGTAASAPT